MIRLGIEQCVANPPAVLAGRRFGLLMNQASVDQELRLSCEVLSARFPGRLAAILSPQHGLWGEQQANMIESPHGWYEPLRLPVYSLYSQTRRPTDEMLDGLECLVVDLQDVGTRVYTFVWTMSYCLEACAAAGIPLVVLDRPNPLGGEVCEGPLLDEGWASFVGRLPLPMRHGLTMGELALLVQQQLSLRDTVHVVPLAGWSRRMLFRDTGRPWVLPSPNMPRWETALLYPGQVLLEGTNLSEGRGTTLPFEVVGAPFIDPHRLCHELRRQHHPGLQFRPIRFVPMFDKWQGRSCGGVAWHVVDPGSVRSFRATLAVLQIVRRLWPDDFAWLAPPYEYEYEKLPIDILYGSARLRESLDADADADLDQLACLNAGHWQTQTASVRLYDG